MKLIKINNWDKTTLYQAEIGKHTFNVEVERIKDRRGTLLRAESSLTGYFECYGLDVLKNKLQTAYNIQYN